VDTFCHASVPGITAGHAVVGPEGRASRGQEGAFEEAARILKAEYDAVLASPANSDVEFHLVITVVSPTNAVK
jgi:hypothetical protein